MERGRLDDGDEGLLPLGEHADVIRDTIHAAKTGAIEICFLGQNVNGYKYTDENGQEYEVEPETFQVEVSPYEENVTNVKQLDESNLLTGENRKYVIAGCIGVILILVIIGAIAILKKQEEKEVK